MANFDSHDRELHFGLMLGQSKCFGRVLASIPLIAQSDLAVLISGETGTGKDLVARAIHYQSPRKHYPFIPVSGALPDHLCENELFGHVQGAFTGANSTEKGLVAEAESGTLFLDDVETLNPGTQAKLLRFLQNGEYRPLGSSKLLHANVRIITATNSDLRNQVRENKFREDLYYRLCVLSLEIPPLRDRVEDIPLLASYFSNAANENGKAGRNETNPFQLTPEILRKLVAYHWPGNIRELKTVIERAKIFTSSRKSQTDSFTFLDELEVDDEVGGNDKPGIQNGAVREPRMVGTLQQEKRLTIQKFEQTYVSRLLQEHRGNVSHAAKAAGMARRTLQRLLQKYQMDPNAFRNLS